MQNFSLGENLHEMSDPFFQGQYEKYHWFVVSELAQRMVKSRREILNPCPAKPGYVLSLQTV